MNILKLANVQLTYYNALYIYKIMNLLINSIYQ